MLAGEITPERAMSVGSGMHPRASASADRMSFDLGLRRVVVRLPRHGVAALGIVLALMTAWSLAAGVYVLFHDAVVAELRASSKVAARGYDAQIAALRDDLERTRTRRLVEKAGVDERLAALADRQAAIEKRQSRLAEITEGMPLAGGPAEAAMSYSLKPTPLDRPAALDGIGSEPAPGRSSALDAADKVAASLDAVEAGQARALEAVGAKTVVRRRTLEKVYDAARVPKPAAAADGRARGGPFEPLDGRARDFEARADQVAAERALTVSFERGLNRVPLRTPSPGSSVSSGFGARLDPFLGRPAFHAGLDFETGFGEPVKATAEGRVVSAGWSGGYGNMVEIDHGGGLSTRFGHMSSIAVSEGDVVKIGTVLGRVGSTGRSTGPHVHYETRVNGEAVDPLRFLNAGRMLAATR